MSTSAADKYPALVKFLQHSDESYHLEQPTEEIREALIGWYALNRRRLPWRGDAPPYNGSTAGINAVDSKAAAAVVPPPPPAAPGAGVSAYGVWVSEIMCQQTRVEAVIPYWEAWMQAFPTVEALAAATEEEVNARWAGLGFYRRARMLHEASRQVVGELGGVLPTSVDELMRIKGIGRYTAGAVASISAGVAAPVVDGNVLRVLSRLCAIAANPKEAKFCADGKLAWRLAEQLVRAGGGAQPGELNQALMELGATLCAPGGSGVDGRDPLAPFYASAAIGRDAHRAHRRGELGALLDEAGGPHGVRSCPVCRHGAPALLEALRSLAAEGCTLSEEGAASLVHQALPLPVPKKARREERLAVAALFCAAAATPESGGGGGGGGDESGGWRWLLVRRPEGGLLAGQWEFPHAVVAEDKEALPDDPGAAARCAATTRLLQAAEVDPAGLGERAALPAPLEHIFSHVRHTMHVEHARAPAPPAGGAAASSSAQWTAGRRSYRWMDEAQMKEVGVTAGVLKVIAAVRAARGEDGEGGTAAKRPAAKRKGGAAAAGSETDARQPKLSSFFKKKLDDA